MANRKNEQFEGLRELSIHEMELVQGAGGWGMAQYQYGFEGTYSNSALISRTEGDLRTKLNK